MYSRVGFPSSLSHSLDSLTLVPGNSSQINHLHASSWLCSQGAQGKLMSDYTVYANFLKNIVKNLFAFLGFTGLALVFTKYHPQWQYNKVIATFDSSLSTKYKGKGERKICYYHQ